MERQKIYDCVIIGAGPAGLTAAIYLGRYQREILLLTNNFGGQTAIAGSIENFPGFSEINGAELIGKMLSKVKSVESAEIISSKEISGIKKRGTIFVISCSNGSEFKGKTVLITTGRRHRTLGIRGEEGLIGRGLSYCATCDGTFARGKKVAVIGGGYSATESALILEKIAEEVALINISAKLSGETITLDKVAAKAKIKAINNAETTAIVTDKNGFVSAVKYRSKKEGKIKSLACQMVFVEIGQTPNSEPFKNITKQNNADEIVVNAADNSTPTSGIVAAGDITNITAKQTVVACGEGAKAAIAINRFLELKKN